ncbi:hypothetical protein ACVDG8_008520 [Mesorhizobium sp. ORM8.1]
MDGRIRIAAKELGSRGIAVNAVVPRNPSPPNCSPGQSRMPISTPTKRLAYRRSQGHVAHRSPQNDLLTLMGGDSQVREPAFEQASKILKRTAAISSAPPL